MARSIVNVRYSRSVKGVQANARYIGFRARELATEEKGLFNAHMDNGADYKLFVNRIQQHPALQHDLTVKAHTMVLSFRETDYEAFVRAGGEFKQVARDFVRDLEERKGIKLEWIGAFHEKSGHPHIHLSIMSVGVDASGTNRRLFLNKQDMLWLTKNLDQYLERYVPQEPQHAKTKHVVQKWAKSRLREAKQTVSQTQHFMEKLAHDTGTGKFNERRSKRHAKSRRQIQKQAEREHTQSQGPSLSH